MTPRRAAAVLVARTLALAGCGGGGGAPEIDQKIWQEAHSVALYARPGAVAVPATLANFGASGLADPDYVDAGFVK